MTGARRIWFALLFGLGGLSVLLYLGVWQAGRYSERLDQIDDLKARVADAPLELGGTAAIDTLSQSQDEFRRIEVVGRFIDAPPVRMIHSRKPYGPGSLYFAAFEAERGGIVIVERGFAPEFTEDDLSTPPGRWRLSGVLRWPDEIGYFTPAPDPEARLTFARNVEPLAEMLDAAPILIVLDQPPEALTPGAVERGRFPAYGEVSVNPKNDHLGYAITWFSLAAVWAAMTGVLLWRRGG